MKWKKEVGEEKILLFWNYCIVYFYDEYFVDGEMFYEGCIRWFYKFCMCCFKKLVNVFKYDNIKVV